MSLTSATTAASIAPRLYRRKTTVGLNLGEPSCRSASPAQLRFVSACTVQLSNDSNFVEHLPQRTRSASASLRPVVNKAFTAPPSSPTFAALPTAASPRLRQSPHLGSLPSPHLGALPTRRSAPHTPSELPVPSPLFLTTPPVSMKTQFSDSQTTTPPPQAYFSLPPRSPEPLHRLLAPRSTVTEPPPSRTSKAVVTAVVTSTTTFSAVEASSTPTESKEALPSRLSACATEPYSEVLRKRSSDEANRPPMVLESSKSHHIIRIDLPGYATEEVTLTVGRNNMLNIVADRWGSEGKCHHQWAIKFTPRDAYLTSMHAAFNENGTLTLNIPRTGAFDKDADPRAYLTCRLT